jgi:hypothetical protein
MARQDDEHRYDQCGTEDCPRFPCRVWKEGYVRGYAEGSAAGYAAGRLTASRRVMPPVVMLPSVPAGSHPHLHPAVLALLLAAAAAGYVVLAVTRPTRRCWRCGGDRIRFIRHWITGKARTRSCRRCSGTGRIPRLGGRIIHRLIWSIRHERK